MTPPLDKLFQDETGEPMSERRGSTGEALVNIALGLMREVKEDLKGMDKKLDEIAKERRDEAREHGELEARLRSIEEFRKNSEHANRANRGLAAAAPTTGTWKVGDICVQLTPVVGQPKGWRCTAAGAPGTWVSEGNL